MTTKRKRTPTTKQLTALKLINGGMSKRQAMLKAGYSERVANNPKTFLMNSEAIKSVVEQFEIELRSEGITRSYLAKKFSEWLDATDVVTGAFGPIKDKDTGLVVTRPNYKTQLEAGKMLKEIYNITPDKQTDPNLTKRITLEEFIQT